MRTYYANTKKRKTCILCGKILVKEQVKYCSHSCSTSHTRLGKPSPRKGKKYSTRVPKFKCKVCGKPKFKNTTCHACLKYVERPHKQSIKAPAPFKGYLLFKPTIGNTKRTIIRLLHRKTQHRITMTLARFVMSIGLRRTLDKSMHVDHIDMNPENEHWTNLQLLTAQANVSKGHSNGIKTRKSIKYTCPTCLTQRIKRQAQIKLPILTFCSKECRYAFSHKSCNYQNKSMMLKAKKINNVIAFVEERKSTYSLEGEKIPVKTKGMRRVHNFLIKHGIHIL